MQLVTVHKIMISASIGASLLFALWAGWMYGHADSRSHLALAVVAVATAAALVIYLRRFSRKQGRGWSTRKRQ